jgi:hypothetical protein
MMFEKPFALAGMDQYLLAMQSWSGERGREIGVEFAEGFRQHLGHSYPQDNVVGKLLGVLEQKA